jgi:hypothetical protein
MGGLLQMLILVARVGAPSGGLSIERAELDGTGTLRVWCAFRFDRAQRVYSWRGSLQPGVGRIAFLDVIDDGRREIPVRASSEAVRVCAP